jgi:hypothetical protein
MNSSWRGRRLLVIVAAAAALATVPTAASAATGAVGTASDPGTPTITLSASSTVVTYDDQSVTFSGTATVTDSSGTTTALPQVTLQDTGSFSEPLTTTGPDGSFETTIQDPDIQEEYFVTVAASASVAFGSSPDVEITAHQDPVQLTAQISSSQVNYGAMVKITGVASYTPAGGSAPTPLKDTTVQLYGGPPQDSNFEPYATAVTGPDGSFSIQLKALGTTTWTVYAGGLPEDYYPDQLLQQATANLQLNVAMPVQIRNLRTSLSPEAVLTVKGCLTVTARPDGFALPLTVEYSATGRSAWKSLGTIRSYDPSPCDGALGGQSFSGHVTVKLAAAHYRLVYGGSSGYQPAVSTSVYAWKYATRISSLTVSPRSVGKGGKITVSGRLQQYSSRRWRDVGGQQVRILLRPKGSKVWYWIYQVRTNSKGYFTKKFTDPVTATWSAEYLGGATRFSCGAAGYNVTLRGR